MATSIILKPNAIHEMTMEVLKASPENVFCFQRERPIDESVKLLYDRYMEVCIAIKKYHDSLSND